MNHKEAREYLRGFDSCAGLCSENTISELINAIQTARGWLIDQPKLFEKIFDIFDPEYLHREQADVPGYKDLESLLQSVCGEVRSKHPLRVWVL